MKRKIALFVSMIQLLCFVLPIGQVSADNTYRSQLAAEIANAYYNKACEFTAEISEWTLNTSFYIYDIDKNGIPELIALDCTAYAGGMDYYFYTYSDGSVKSCGSFLGRDAEFPYKYSEGNGVVMMYARQGYFIGTLCTLENGALSDVKEYSHEETISKFDCENGSLEEITGEFKPAEEPKEIDYNAIYTAVNELLDVPDEAIIEAPAINVLLNGQAIAFDQPPIIVDDRTLVPLRAIFEALGATVDWNGDTQTVVATKGNTVIRITIGDNKLYVDDTIVELDVPARIVNDRTLVPVRAVSEAFGCNVDWDGDKRTVYIVTENTSNTPKLQKIFETQDENAWLNIDASFNGKKYHIETVKTFDYDAYNNIYNINGINVETSGGVYGVQEVYLADLNPDDNNDEIIITERFENGIIYTFF